VRVSCRWLHVVKEILGHWGVPIAIKERRYTRTKGTGLGIRSREHIVVSGV